MCRGRTEGMVQREIFVILFKVLNFTVKSCDQPVEESNDREPNFDEKENCLE